MKKSEGLDRVKRLLMWGCVAALVLSSLPLNAIAPYNHPNYDDYGFSAPVRHAWQQTGSLGAALSAAWQAARNTRMTWQGTYTGTLLSNLQPGVFSEEWYFLSSFFLLTAFIVCFLFLFSTAFGALGLDGGARASLGCLAVALMLQLMPDAGEAFYWFNGGVGNTFIYSLMALAAALLIRLCLSGNRASLAALMAALCVLMVLLGGGSYGGGLFGLCMLGLATAAAFVRRNAKRACFAALFALFLICFAYSMSAPGNAVRADRIGYHGSAVKAIAQSLYYGVAQMGGYIRLPLIAVTLAVAPLLYGAAGRSRFSFRHPWLALGLLTAVYCTQLTPPLYSIAGIGAGRIVNTYFQSFVVLWFLYAYYLLGFAARHLKEWSLPALTARGYGALLLASACLLGVGCLGVKPEGEALYGVQNLNGISAALSIATGEARQYDLEMTQREKLLNDASQPVVTLKPLTAVPDVFMDDLLTPGAEYDARPSLCLYYGKEAIRIEGEAAAP
ncbi:MAG: hypothetical protein MRZ54_01300 [Clostridiales bacterium]|nr:hypothetical protein [Clostridiales bacterium]